MTVTIRTYNEAYKIQFNHLIELNNEETDLKELINSSNLRFAYGAFKDERLIGILFAWKNDFHPNCLYFRILSHPFYRQEKIEVALLEQVIGVENLSLPLQTSVWESAIPLNHLYKLERFREIRKTYMPTLKINDTIIRHFHYETKYPIRSLEEIRNNNILIDQLVTLVKANYESTHTVNPVANLDVQRWRKLVFSDDLLMDLSYICLCPNEENILAYVFLHEADQKDIYELGWVGTAIQTDIQLILPLVSKQLYEAKQNNVHTITGEFDTTDEWAMEVFKSFPFLPCPAWITYQKEIQQ